MKNARTGNSSVFNELDWWAHQDLNLGPKDYESIAKNNTFQLVTSFFFSPDARQNSQ